MTKQKKSTPRAGQGMTALERLGLRVSSMTNHPIAQAQRWVTIHRLDTDGDMEWEEVMGSWPRRRNWILRSTTTRALPSGGSRRAPTIATTLSPRGGGRRRG